MGAFGISIVGATGEKAPNVNGTFKQTSKVVNGKPVYENVHDDTKSLFFSANRFWTVGVTGKVNDACKSGFGYIPDAGLAAPVGAAESWKIQDGNNDWS